MGNWNSGRRPTPTAIKLLRGNPGKRRLNHEPTIPPADPSFDVPPAEIAGDVAATTEWARVAPMLRAAGLVTASERAALTALCQQWSIYLSAHAEIIAHGMVTKDKSTGRLRATPYLGIADAALTHCHKLWNELGLTPSGRARASKLPAPADDTPSKWEGLLS